MRTEERRGLNLGFFIRSNSDEVQVIGLNTVSAETAEQVFKRYVSFVTTGEPNGIQYKKLAESDGPKTACSINFNLIHGLILETALRQGVQKEVVG